MISLLFQLGVIILLMAWNKFLAPSAGEKAKKPAIGDFNLPRIDEATPIPLFWGTVRIRGPHVIFARDFHATPLVQQDVVVGYKYRIAMQFLLGAPGGTDGAGAPATLRRFWVGERLAWVGAITDPSALVYVNKPDLLGGPQAGGGVEGVISFATGSFTQTNGTILKAELAATNANVDVAYRGQAVVSLFGIQGDNIHTSSEQDGDAGYYFVDGARIENADTRTILYPGVVPAIVIVSSQPPPGISVVYSGPNNGQVTLSDVIATRGFNVGEAPQIDGYSFEAFAPTWRTLNGSLIGPIGQDANPACVLFDILTNPWDRVGRDSSTIDQASFLAAANVLKSDAERNGFSLWLGSSMSSRDAIKLILEQIDGVLYDDIATGKLKLALIREDYTVGALDVLDPSNVLEVVSYSAGTWNQTYNLVRVTFTDRTKQYQDAAATQPDQANFFRTTPPRFRIKEVSYPGCTNQWLANRLASRDLRAVSLPFAKLRIRVNRDAYTKRPGDVFRFTWPEFNGMTDVVFRVVKYDLGKPGDEAVVLDCVQDRWAFDQTVFDQPGWQIIPFAPPWVSTERKVEEAPRWMANLAYLAGHINAPDTPRLWYAAVPRARAATIRGQVTPDLVLYQDDVDTQAFPTRGTVETAYTRANEPYDTATGLRVTGIDGPAKASLPSATTAQIGSYGRNLIRVGDELMSYESATLVSGTAGDPAAVWRLDNVWRGLLDTVPVAHGIGERVYFLGTSTIAALGLVGRAGFSYADTPTARMPVSGLGGTVTPDTDDDDTMAAIAQRAAQPYPVCDLKLAPLGGAATKTPAQLAEGQLDLTWKRRNRLSATIKRGDAADEAPGDAGTSFEVVSKKGTDATQAIASGLAFASTSYAGALLGLSGFGTIGVGARAVIKAGGAGGQDLINWQTALIDVDAPHWRNLLRNGRFSDGLNGWTTQTGTPSVGSTAGNALGGGGSYFQTTAASACEIRQTVDIAGYTANRLCATVQFFYRNLGGDADDTTTITLEGLDGASSVVDTASSTFTPSTTQWKHSFVNIANLSSSVVKLRVRLQLTAVTDTTPSSVLTEVILRLGEMSTSNQVLNPSFELGAFTNWTNVTNSFKAATATQLYTDAQYAQAGDFASSEIRQDITIPAGYEIGSEFVLELARMNLNADNDTGEVIVEVNGGGAPLASVTTGAEKITPAAVWQRRRLVLTIPQGSTTIRIRLVAVRGAGVTCDTCFDDLDGRFHKHLDADSSTTLTFTTPASQALPADLDHWDRAYPSITPPNLALWNGDSFRGQLGTETDLYVDEAVVPPPTYGDKFIGAYDASDAGKVITSAWSFGRAQQGGIVARESTFASFRSADPFTFVVAIKVDPAELGQDMDVISRYDPNTGTGWRLWISGGSGVATAEVFGAVTKTATGTRNVQDGGVRLIAIIYDPVAGFIRVVDEDGAVSTATAGLGEIFTDTAIPLMIGQGEMGTYVGQIARIWGWSSALSTATVSSLMTQGNAPPNASSLVSSRSTGYAVRVGTDPDGEIWSFFGPDQIALAYSTGLGGFGLPSVPNSATYGNKVAVTDQNPQSANWTTVGATVAFEVAPGVQGLKESFTVAGTNVQGHEIRNLTVGAGTVRVVFFARASSAHSVRLELFNSAGVSKGTNDVAITTSWARYEVTFAGWDASTATCRVRFCGSNTGASQTGEFCAPICVNQSAESQVGIPISSASAAFVQSFTYAAAAQLNVEGEIAVTGISTAATPADCTVLEASNGVNNNDRRNLLISGGTGKATADQYDGAATNVQSLTGAIATWNAQWTLRSRWCRAALLDQATAFGGVLYGNSMAGTKAYGRAAAWTPGTAVLNTWKIGAFSVGNSPNAIIKSISVTAREQRLS